MLAFWIILGIFIFLVFAALSYSYVFYRIAFHRRHGAEDPYYGLAGDDDWFSPEQKKQIRVLVDRAIQIPYERVFTASDDGVKLSACYYHAQEGAPLAILCHGYHGVGIRDMAGECPRLLERGINVLLIDQRAHGESGGKTISFGVKERYDVLAWIRYAIARFGADTEIVLCGISMGAATVLMTLALDLPENVRGVIADCPFTTPEAIVGLVGKRMKIPAPLCLPFAGLGARLNGGFSITGADAAAAAAQNKGIPILLIHGEEDRFVPISMSDTIAEKGGAYVRYLRFPGAGHGLSFLADEPRYCKEFFAFCDRIFTKNHNDTKL